MDSLEGYFVYDHLLEEPMSEAGWQLQTLSWREKDVDWNQFDVVLIRSPWDYQKDAKAFLSCLQRIEASSAVLENPLALVRWNIDKAYLREIEQKGIPVVPTLWQSRFDLQTVQRAFTHFDTDELIIKPLVSANADDTFRLDSSTLQACAGQLAEVFCQRQHMIQPFLNTVIDEGEYSLFYFGGQYSHAIIKRPKEADFRVQEEHGGRLESIEPTPELLTLAERTLAAIPYPPLYARLDFIRHGPGFAVMELELIEPSLYFNMDEESPRRFSRAFVEKFGPGQPACLSR